MLAKAYQAGTWDLHTQTRLMLESSCSKFGRGLVIGELGGSLCNQLDLHLGPATLRGHPPTLQSELGTLLSITAMLCNIWKNCNAEFSCDHPLRSDEWFARLQKTYHSGLTEKEDERTDMPCGAFANPGCKTFTRLSKVQVGEMPTVRFLKKSDRLYAFCDGALVRFVEKAVYCVGSVETWRLELLEGLPR